MENRIQLCGPLVVEIEGRRLEDDLPARQGRVLFAYLTANRDRPCGRTELIEALWPHDLPARPETALSALLSKLRRVLGPQLLAGRSSVRLTLPAGAWIDLEAASEAIHRAESAIALQDWPTAWGAGRAGQRRGSSARLRAATGAPAGRARHRSWGSHAGAAPPTTGELGGLGGTLLVAGARWTS